MSSTTTERVGRYQLLEPIGFGPSGAVSRAKVFGVAGFERQFAIKRFHAEVTSTAALAQALSAAARAYGGLEHPRIARMSEFGVAQGTTFTAVELVAGLDALRLIAEARLAGVTLAAGGALALVSQAARAVGYAHGRGLTHLGLAPTNVMITAEGDIKITDFGILSATLPQRPTDSARLAQRIQYLAPEQLANEATSAATDVFALGILAYELVTGQRTFKGDTPQQVAQSVMTGPPNEPPLPRPIVRVLQRCLARSPFERFPDARALADALDAALRVAPVPGTRKDIGQYVKQTLDRLAELNESNLSGMVALNVGTGPMRTFARDPQDDAAPSTHEFVRPDVPVAGPSALLGPGRTEPARTLQDFVEPISTMPGLPPPPAPAPKALGAPLVGPPAASTPAPATLLGIAGKPPPIPMRPSTGKPIRVSDAASNVAPVPTLARPSSDHEADLAISVEELEPDLDLSSSGRHATSRGELDDPAFELGPPPSDEHRATLPNIPDPGILDATRFDASTRVTREVTPILDDLPAVPPKDRAGAGLFDPIGPAGQIGSVVGSSTPAPVHPRTLAGVTPSQPIRTQHDDAHDDDDDAAFTEIPPSAFTNTKPEPIVAPPEPVAPPPEPIPLTDGPPPTPFVPSMAPAPFVPHAVPVPSPAPPRPEPERSKMPLILGSVAAAAVLAVGGWFVYGAITGNDTPGGGSGKIVTPPARDAGATSDATQVAATSVDAAQVATATPDAAATPDAKQIATATPDAATPDAKQVASVPVDAATTPIDAAQVASTPDAGGKPTPGSALSITSTPAGARVFLDGADAGQTPLKLPGTPDRHTVALLLAGHELYVAQVDGRGTFSIPLKEVTPTGGPAGIKVLKCKDKDRYYVFIDGKPTGQTCPSERIETELGAHTVEVYDVVSETRRKWEIEVKDTRLSYRVRVE